MVFLLTEGNAVDGLAGACAKMFTDLLKKKLKSQNPLLVSGGLWFVMWTMRCLVRNLYAQHREKNASVNVDTSGLPIGFNYISVLFAIVALTIIVVTFFYVKPNMTVFTSKTPYGLLLTVALTVVVSFAHEIFSFVL